MKQSLCYITLLIVATLSFQATIHAQVATSVGLVLKTDSTDNVLMPRIVQILPNTAADAEPDIKVGMYLLKISNIYCRNADLGKLVDLINNGDEEGTPVGLFFSDDKDTFPKHPMVLRRGKPLPKTDQ